MRVLAVQHQESAPPGMIGERLAEHGVDLAVVRPDLGQPVPDSLAGYAGLLVLGGSMGAYDDTAVPWLPRVRDLLASATAEAIPTLGICLGHQLLAAATGGVVDRHPAGRRIGTVTVSVEPEAGHDPVFGALGSRCRAVRWHQDVVHMPPPQARILATGDGDVHGIRVGSCAWGVQAHPEASAPIVATWARETEQRIRADGDASDPSVAARVADVRAALEDVRARENELLTDWRPFVDAFADYLRARRPLGHRHGPR